MTTVHLFGVQPDVGAAGKLRCELVILAIAAADKNFKAVGRDKAQRALLFRLIGFCALLLFEIASRYLVYNHRNDVLPHGNRHGSVLVQFYRFLHIGE